MHEPASMTGAVVLAAGGSSRLGQPKQLLRVSGATLLERTVDALLADARIWPVVVVLGASGPEVRAAVARRPVLFAENAAWAEGMASSLRTGLGTLRQFSRGVNAALFALCDQPAFDVQVVRQLVDAYTRNPTGAVAAVYDGHAGAPAILSRDMFPALEQLTGDQGARKLLAQLPPSALKTLDLPQLAIDVDTPEDLRLLGLTNLQTRPKL